MSRTVPGADTNRIATRDEISRALCVSFYSKGSIYDASMDRVIQQRWPEWREQADALLAQFAIFHRAALDASREK